MMRKKKKLTIGGEQFNDFNFRKDVTLEDKRKEGWLKSENWGV